MAYLKQEDDEENNPQNIPIGSSGGFLGGGDFSSSSTDKQNAPTSSGAKFVNLQRYLDQNSLTGTGQKIQNKTNDILNSEGNNFNTSTQPVKDFLNTQGNSQEHQLKTDNGFGFIGGLANRWNNLDANPNGFDDLLTSKSGNAPANASWSFSPESSDKVKALSNMQTLAPELASDRSRYTSGMSALDQAIYGADNSTKGAINGIQGNVDSWSAGKNSDLASLNSGIDKFKSDEDQTAAATRAYLKQLYDENEAKGQMAYDPTGKQPRRLSILSNLLGQPNDFKFAPIPHDLTPEGKAESAQKKMNADELKVQDDFQRKYPNLNRKLNQRDDNEKLQSEGDSLEPRGGYNYGMGTSYDDAGNPIFGAGNNSNGLDWYNSVGGPRSSKTPKPGWFNF